jgi:hypothetical protein
VRPSSNPSAYKKKNKTKPGGVAQVVKPFCKALSSNSSTAKRKKEKLPMFDLALNWVREDPLPSLASEALD